MAHRNIGSTFPIQTEELLWQKLKRIASSPITWASGVAALASLGLAPSLGIGAIIGAGILGLTGWYWKKKLPALEEKIITELISKSNSKQNDALNKSVSQLQKWDCEDYAKQLTGIIELKKQVEFAIHSQDPRTSIDENLETLIDTLCNEVSRDLFKIADIRYTMRKKRRKLPNAIKDQMRQNQDELEERVKEAHTALQDVKTQLIQLTGKTIPDAGDNPLLDKTIKRLREEADLASRIRHRINITYGDELESASEMETSKTTYSSGSIESQ